MREDVGKMRHGMRKGLSHKEAAPKYKARLLRRVGLWRII